MSSKHSLLTLPSEIRNQIYILVHDASAAPPKSPADAGPRYLEAVKGFGRRSVLYPIPSIRNESILALSLCSRQLKQELHEIISNPSNIKNTTHELDLMLQGCRIWPTWTNLSYPVAEMEHLKVNLRLFDVKSGGGLFWGCGGPGLTFVVLFRAMNRLLHHGPHFLYSRKTMSPMKIGTFTLNVLHGYGTTPTPTDNMFKSHDDPELKCKDFIVLEQSRIYDHIRSHLQQVVASGLLTGKIQTVQICDGEGIKALSTVGITPSNEPTDEWLDYGFIWGVDKDMKVEKVESKDVCLHQR
ncbi:MAG: hypothetical protein L6R41_006398 [Letrouitia leprolyta]|nr:MAG: hypothetical protein L6R41_006398 [Letrouitia leprolyta]